MPRHHLGPRMEPGASSPKKSPPSASASSSVREFGVQPVTSASGPWWRGSMARPRKSRALSLPMPSRPPRAIRSRQFVICSRISSISGGVAIAKPSHVIDVAVVETSSPSSIKSISSTKSVRSNVRHVLCPSTPETNDDEASTVVNRRGFTVVNVTSTSDGHAFKSKPTFGFQPKIMFVRGFFVVCPGGERPPVRPSLGQAVGGGDKSDGAAAGHHLPVRSVHV